MCKILILTNTRKVTNFTDLVETAAVELKTQRDGFGWAAVDESGAHFGERTNQVDNFETALKRPISVIPWAEDPGHNTFGDLTLKPRAVIFHGRISTNNKDLVNVHPIRRDGWSLIHNGVVTHHGEKYATVTNNDSEHVLFNLQTGGIDKLAKNLTGYYAFAAFDPAGNLLMGRDRIANLYVAYSDALESYIYATTEELIKATVRKCLGYNVTMPRISKVKDDVYFEHRADATIHWQTFTSLGRDSHSSQLAHLSLGRDLDQEDAHTTTTTSSSTPGTSTSNASAPSNSGVYSRYAELKKRYLVRWTADSRGGGPVLVDSETNREVTPHERAKMEELVIKLAKDRRERKALKRFYRAIHFGDKLQAFTTGGVELSWTWFKLLHPEIQLSYEVIDSNTGAVIDPYYWELGGRDFKQKKAEKIPARAPQAEQKAETSSQDPAPETKPDACRVIALASRENAAAAGLDTTETNYTKRTEKLLAALDEQVKRARELTTAAKAGNAAQTARIESRIMAVT